MTFTTALTTAFATAFATAFTAAFAVPSTAGFAACFIVRFMVRLMASFVTLCPASFFRLTFWLPLLALCLTTQPLGAMQQEAAVGASSVSSAAITPKPRPKIALVLSGGGARGFAHIGVLRALNQMRVPIDMVVGTSMGSVVGGAFAAGSSVDALEAMVRQTDWDGVLADRPPRSDLTFRRKEEDVLLPSRIDFGVSLSGAELPPAAAGNAALEFALMRLLPDGRAIAPVDQLHLPFRAVASDLLDGEMVELRDTPLFLTLRASLAFPGLFAPVRVNQRLLVDGGLVRNLPVDIARAMGADVVIAVNVGTPLAPETELRSALSVAQQVLGILTEQNVKRSLKELRPSDILIAPSLEGISFLDFRKHDAAMAAGERAALALAERLQVLAQPEAAYVALEDYRLAAPALAGRALPLAKMEVLGSEKIAAATLLAQSGLTVGQPTAPEQVREAASRLYGRGDLERVEADISDLAGQRSVLFRTQEAPWARRRMRVGLELSSDFADSNSFSVGFMHVASSINELGGELRTLARLGTRRSLGVQLWQPLWAGSSWYVEPSLGYGATASDLFDLGRRRLRYASSSAGGSLVLGRQFGNWGDLQLGVTRQATDKALLIPQDPNIPVQRTLQTNQFVQFRLDTLDSLAFPSSGAFMSVQLGRSPSVLPNDESLASTSLAGLKAFRSGDWAGHIYSEWAKAQTGNAPASLGGFLRLSGSTPNSLDGHTVMLGRVAVARRIGDLPTALGGLVRAGLSFEVGGAFAQNQSITLGDLKQAGSAFLSVDTRFGPLYFGAGVTRSAGSTLYLFLGPIW